MTPLAATSDKKSLALKGLLLLLAIVLPGGSLLLVALATWKTMKATRSRGEVAAKSAQPRLAA